MTTWIQALKIWNDKREGKYMIPRKGTEEHAQVMSIMKGQQNGKGLRQVGTGHKKKTKMDMGYTEGGSLRKALNLAKKDPKQFVDIVNSLTQKGSGMEKQKQKGGFLPAFIVPFIPSIVSALGTAAGAFATGAAAAAGAAIVDEIVGEGHSYNGKQKAFLKALEGEKKTTRKNKARDARVMRRYKKIVKGGNLEKLALENPDILYNLGKLAYNVQEAPKLEDGKLQVPKTPLENLWSSIFG